MGIDNIRHEPYDKYRENEALNCSTLKMFDSTFRNLSNTELNGFVADERAWSKEMVLGHAFHEMLLEPSLFKTKTDYYRVAMTEDQRVHLHRMKDKVLSNPTFKKILGSALVNREVSHYCKYKGFDLKGRFDMVHPQGFVFDLKNTHNIGRFSYVFDRFDYGLQAGFYAIIFNQCYNIKIRSFTYLIQEYKEDYRTAQLEIKGDRLEEYMKRVDDLLDEYKEWKKDKIIKSGKNITIDLKLKGDEKCQN